MLETREAFLTAIFDAPDDDLPRLAFADWLDDRGEAAFARYLRICVSVRSMEDDQLLDEPDLLDEKRRLAGELRLSVINFNPPLCLELDAGLLSDAHGLRTLVATEHPDWFGGTRIKIVGGKIVGGNQIETLFSVPCFRRCFLFDFSGLHTPYRPLFEDPSDKSFFFPVPPAVTDPENDEYEVRPAITVLGVEALAKHPAGQRIAELDLTHNDLDNDAARMLVKSPFLTNLNRLEIREGNQLRGSTWSQLVERFGDEVVG